MIHRAFAALRSCSLDPVHAVAQPTGDEDFILGPE